MKTIKKVKLKTGITCIHKKKSNGTIVIITKTDTKC